MVGSHIILLPRDNYFDWVRATAKYVLNFGISITPDPKKAGQKEAITVVVAPNGYPAQGDIVKWLENEYPTILVDVIRVDTPDELRKVLEKRVDVEMQFSVTPAPLKVGKEVVVKKVTPTVTEEDVPIDLFEELEADSVSPDLEITELREFKLVWPTDYSKITQPFGANPEIYSKWGLPGHEGLDIRAPMNTNVYACADGEVFYINNKSDNHPYGKHIRLRHNGGYRTIYAHLASINVNVGDYVSAKQIIGKADSTGNSTGSHLHLTLKKEGASARKETHFKGDVIDPTPFLVFSKEGVDFVGKRKYRWSRPALVGVNVRDDGFMHSADFDVVETARLEAVKVQENTPTKAIQKLLSIRKDMFIMVRLSFELGQTRVSAKEWTARIMPDIERLYDMGLRYFEVHQSPNLQAYGLNYSWFSGGGFARWWMDVTHQLRDRYPEARFGFPGVSPGGQVEGQRLDAKTFLEQADDAIRVADWVGVNCFWNNGNEMHDEEKGAFYKFVRRRFPDKLIMVTEFGNVNTLTNPYVKGNEYAKFYQQLQAETGIAAAFSQVMSSPKGFDGMQWRDETGVLTRIPIQVGKR